MKKFGCILLAVIAFCLVPVCVLAADHIIKVTCPSVNDAEVIAKKNSNGSYTVYLPGCWDLSRLMVAADENENITIGKKSFTAGSEVDLTDMLDKQYTCSGDKKKNIGKVTIRQGSDIPCVFLTVDEKQFNKVRKSKNEIITEGEARFIDNDGTESACQIDHFKGRGNSTFSYEKKPFELKLKKKMAVSGMPEEKTWLLIANYLDVSLLRNEIILNLSKAIGLPYALNCTQIDLWVNGIYQGLYLMTEKVQIKSSRVNIRNLEKETEKVNDDLLSSYSQFHEKTDELPVLNGYEIPNDPDDITGGYIAVIEKPHRLNSSKRPGFRTSNLLSVRIKEPTCPSRAQVAYFASLVNEMHEAIVAEDGVNQKTGKAYTEYLDIHSFALKFLIEDLTKNYDAVSGSQYFFKDSDARDGLVYAGPSWDYDLCCGNMSQRGEPTSGDYAAKVTVGPCNLYKQLAKHVDFMEEVARCWREDVRPQLAILLGETDPVQGGVMRSFDGYRSNIEKSAVMNNKRWGSPSKYVNKNAGTDFTSGNNRLKKWLTDRIAYMDKRYAEQNGG